MNNLNPQVYQKAIRCLEQGGVIAYPTESVFGIGADPFNENAVLKVLALKNRPIEKGLILIAADWETLSPYVIALPEERMKIILSTWPGPYTWVFPASALVPYWITGSHKTLAVRVTAHPVAKALCERYRKPLISTSANLCNQPPLQTWIDVQDQFANKIDFIVPGEVGGLQNPTQIRDGLTDNVIRN